ncbi:hypothetical protein ACFFIX_26735, partial [Metabacillus herbersteinensis]
IIKEVNRIGNHVAHFLCDQTLGKWLKFRLSNTLPRARTVMKKILRSNLLKLAENTSNYHGHHFY